MYIHMGNKILKQRTDKDINMYTYVGVGICCTFECMEVSTNSLNAEFGGRKN